MESVLSMTSESFHKNWAETFSNVIPVSHYFKHAFPERWARIHNMPESKRYAETDDESKLILFRQNQVISDVLGGNTRVLLVSADFTEPIFKLYSFTPVDKIDLHAIKPDEYEKDTVCLLAVAEIEWQSGKHDALLKAIADWEVSAFLVSFVPPLILAPYDGGMDIILKDTVSRDAVKAKYRDWLSARPDGL
jgi:hypothetical protein